MLDGGEEAGLALEALGHAGLGVEVVVQDLDGHLAAQGDLFTQVHFPHAARAQRTEDSEATVEDERVGSQHAGRILSDFAFARMTNRTGAGLGPLCPSGCPPGGGLP
ncbi:hypothetical protein MFU01_22840 [Myxococcus fulvus]|uniref:Uncharacterized protein n=1 Tax=Myxococcus fulvus TaxID=33 RepID=A0A511T083_MYXFU|nr:hypothetical protein MFU01_22840 [Myxococcus fulvus]